MIYCVMYPRTTSSAGASRGWSASQGGAKGRRGRDSEKKGNPEEKRKDCKEKRQDIVLLRYRKEGENE